MANDKSEGRGSALAREALERLLLRAENAAAKDPTERARGAKIISIRFSEDSLPDYSLLPSHAEKLECNVCLQLAERAGAISIDWDRRAGDRAHVTRITLRDGEKLADYLQVEPRWNVVMRAQQSLQIHMGSYAALAQLIDTWHRGNMFRGTRPGDIAPWIDSIKVLEYCAAKNGVDIPIRRLSATLFRDSKRIEAIWPALDALTHGDAVMVQSEMEDLFAELGLIKFAPTLLVSGNLSVVYGEQVVAAACPYVGLDPSTIRSIKFDCAQYLLTVENLTTFHELARQRPDNVIVIYTGGMPSPSWRRAYGLFLESLAPASTLHHWSDIDVGGFRIASHIAKCCEDAGRTLHLHGMRADSLPPGSVSRRKLLPAERREILRICERWRWVDEAASLGQDAIEQEAMEPYWPKMVASD